MGKKNYDELPAISFGSRPKVLLLGNGINRSFEGSKTIESIIQAEWKKNYGEELPKSGHPIWGLPFSLQVVAATKDHVQSCMSGLADSFKSTEPSDEQRDFISLFGDTDCDVILSTNYSMEFEKTAVVDYSERRNYSFYRTTQSQTKKQSELGIYQCTELPFSNKKYLWHIHGTALRKSSLIMGQLYYGKLLSEVIDRANKVNALYRLSVSMEKDYSPKSWIDYFLIGDVYIMGFGLDYSETDIWWLLSYKKSAFPDAKTYFYSESINADKRLLLDCYDIKLPSIHFDMKEDNKYIEYYKRILKDISSS